MPVGLYLADMYQSLPSRTSRFRNKSRSDLNLQKRTGEKDFPFPAFLYAVEYLFPVSIDGKMGYDKLPGRCSRGKFRDIIGIHMSCIAVYDTRIDTMDASENPSRSLQQFSGRTFVSSPCRWIILVLPALSWRLSTF